MDIDKPRTLVRGITGKYCRLYRLPPFDLYEALMGMNQKYRAGTPGDAIHLGRDGDYGGRIRPTLVVTASTIKSSIVQSIAHSQRASARYDRKWLGELIKAEYA